MNKSLSTLAIALYSLIAFTLIIGALLPPILVEKKERDLSTGEITRKFEYVGPPLDSILEALEQRSSISDSAKAETESKSYRMFSYNMMKNGHITIKEDREAYSTISKVEPDTGKTTEIPAVLKFTPLHSQTFSLADLTLSLKKAGLAWTKINKSYLLEPEKEGYEEIPESAYVYIPGKLDVDTVDLLMGILDGMDTYEVQYLTEEEIENYAQNEGDYFDKVQHVEITYPFEDGIDYSQKWTVNEYQKWKSGELNAGEKPKQETDKQESEA